jgi:hypothetical protein
MSGSKDGLEITQDLSLQRIEWRVQKVLWVLLAILLLAALLGLLGPGPLSYSSVDGSGFEVRYLRFARWQAPHTLVVATSLPGSETLRISIDRSYLDKMEVQQITPQPATVQLRGDSYLYTFDGDRRSSQTDITFDLQPTSIGSLHGTIGLPAQGSSVEFTELVYP